jgi:hypothetical protein
MRVLHLVGVIRCHGGMKVSDSEPVPERHQQDSRRQHETWRRLPFFHFKSLPSPTASLILLDRRLTKVPAAGTAWQDENQSAREPDTQGGDGIRHVAL